MVYTNVIDSRKQVWKSCWRAEPGMRWLIQMSLTAGSRSEIPTEELNLGWDGEQRSHWQHGAGLRFLLKSWTWDEMVNTDVTDSRKQVWDSYWRAEPWMSWWTQISLTAGSRSEIRAEEINLGWNGEHRSHWQQEAGLRFLLKSCTDDSRKCWKRHMSVMSRCLPRIYVVAQTIVIDWILFGKNFWSHFIGRSEGVWFIVQLMSRGAQCIFLDGHSYGSHH